jgi:hypothetical protein
MSFVSNSIYVVTSLGISFLFAMSIIILITSCVRMLEYMFLISNEHILMYVVILI